MTKHTKGPWLMKRCCASKSHAPTWSIRAPDGERVAEVHTLNKHPREEREANARLLTAAPDLLEAMEAAVVGLTQGACFTCGAEPGVNIDCPGCAWVSRAEAILTKARGP